MTSPAAPSPELIDRFAAIVGPAYAIREPADQQPYLIEWRGLWHGRTPLVLRPGSTGEVSRILALAHETRTAIVPQGGNTGLVGAQIPDPERPQLVLGLGRLDRVRALDSDGNTITVEAGCRLQAVQEAAEAAGRLFPLSLAAEGSCQIGGNLSTNAGGVAVLAYGNARDLVLGLEVVLADGRIWNGLRSLRKDNTGYDLKNLFVGAEGTLGVITAAVLKLFPRPAEQTTAFAGLSGIDQVGALFRLARSRCGHALTAFEAMPARAMEFLSRHVPTARYPLAGVHPWHVLMELSGHRETGETAELAEALFAEAFESGLVADATLASNLAQRRALWHLREALPDTQRLEGGSIKHDVSVPVARIPELIARGDALLERLMPGVRPLPFGHFGDGNIHYNVSQPPGMAAAEFLKRGEQLSEALYALVVGLGGSISAEHGIGIAKKAQLVAVKSPIELELMRRVKAALDPLGILNPGKVL